MKILIIRTIAIEACLSNPTYNTQGIGLATELSKLGNECALVYYAKKGNEREEEIVSDGEKIKVYHIEGHNIVWNAIYNKRLYELCNEYDILQVSECDQICSWQVYRRFPQKTVIYHGPYASKFTWKYNLRSKVFYWILSNRCGFKAARVITKSYLAEKYLKRKGFKNTITLGVGLNHRVFSDVTDVPSEIKSIIDSKGNKKYLLYVGAISKRKNLLFILKVLKELVYKNNHRNYKMIIIGDKAYKENGYFKKCFQYIREENLQDYIVHIPRLEQKYIHYLYKKSDVFLLATQYDIFGMVYLEALYFGVPIVTTNCGGSSLLIREGETGYIRNAEKDEWVNVIEKIAENQGLINEMGRNGKFLIVNEYLWSRLAPKFLAVYNEVLNAK